MHKPIYIARSTGAIAVISFFYLAIAVALILIPWWIALRLLLLVLILLDYYRVLGLYALGTSRIAIQSIQADCGHWLLRLANGKVFKGSLTRQGSYSSAILLILRFTYFGGVRTVLIPRDSISNHNYRFLAMRLNIV